MIFDIFVKILDTLYEKTAKNEEGIKNWLETVKIQII